MNIDEANMILKSAYQGEHGKRLLDALLAKLVVECDHQKGILDKPNVADVTLRRVNGAVVALNNFSETLKADYESAIDK